MESGEPSIGNASSCFNYMQRLDVSQDVNGWQKDVQNKGEKAAEEMTLKERGEEESKRGREQEKLIKI